MQNLVEDGRIPSWKSTHDRVVASRANESRSAGYIGREVVHMTDYETIMVFLGIIGLLISFGGLLIALLTFLDKRNKRK